MRDAERGCPCGRCGRGAAEAGTGAAGARCDVGVGTEVERGAPAAAQGAATAAVVMLEGGSGRATLLRTCHAGNCLPGGGSSCQGGRQSAAQLHQSALWGPLPPPAQASQKTLPVAVAILSEGLSAQLGPSATGLAALSAVAGHLAQVRSLPVAAGHCWGGGAASARCRRTSKLVARRWCPHRRAVRPRLLGCTIARRCSLTRSWWAPWRGTLSRRRRRSRRSMREGGAYTFAEERRQCHALGASTSPCQSVLPHAPLSCFQRGRSCTVRRCTCTNKAEDDVHLHSAPCPATTESSLYKVMARRQALNGGCPVCGARTSLAA